MRKHLQRFGNVFVIGLLRSPLHRLASGSLLLITHRGRRSGRRFTIPVMYAGREGTLTIFVGHPERRLTHSRFPDASYGAAECSQPLLRCAAPSGLMEL